MFYNIMTVHLIILFEQTNKLDGNIERQNDGNS